MELWFVTFASGLAGFIDAIVGGGGLILVPALFSAYPNASAANLFGTNKSASVWGSAFAAWRYQKQVVFNWSCVIPGVLMCLLGSALGAWALLYVPTTLMREALPFVLTGVLIYTLLNKKLGQTHTPQFNGRLEVYLIMLIGLVIGFYDGFFGPGTGSFFVFLFVRVLGYDFLAASAHAKVFNMSTNIAAVTLLAFQGHVWWHLTPFLLVANVVGSYFGSHLALKHGTGFVRWVFVAVVSTLIAKSFWSVLLTH